MRPVLCACLLAACTRNPVEEPARLAAQGRCAEALPLLVEPAAREDGWGRAARAQRARCTYEVLVSSGSTDTTGLRDAVDLLRSSLAETGDAALPGDVGPVTPEALGEAVEHVMRIAIEKDEPRIALCVMEENEPLAGYSWKAWSLAGRARLAMGEWARAGAALERSAGMTSGKQSASSLRLAAGAWHMAGQTEKALVDFSRARSTDPLPWRHPRRLIPEGEEMEHVLGELLAAAVHGVIVTGFTTDWSAHETDPHKLNFLVAEKLERPLLEAEEEVGTLREVIAAGRQDQFGLAAPWLLYQILNMRGLLEASAGDYERARADLGEALSVLPGGEEAEANLVLLSFWTYGEMRDPACKGSK